MQAQKLDKILSPLGLRVRRFYLPEDYNTSAVLHLHKSAREPACVVSAYRVGVKFVSSEVESLSRLVSHWFIPCLG